MRNCTIKFELRKNYKNDSKVKIDGRRNMPYDGHINKEEVKGL